MSFQDLPPNIRALPLTDAQLAADVVDLMIGERDRSRGCIGIMLCDSAFRGLQPVVVNDIPEDTPLEGLQNLLGLLLPIIEPGEGCSSVGDGLTVRSPPIPTAPGTRPPSTRARRPGCGSSGTTW